MMLGYHAGWGMAMGIGMMLFWVLIIVLTVWAVTRFTAGSSGKDEEAIRKQSGES